MLLNSSRRITARAAPGELHRHLLYADITIEVIGEGVSVSYRHVMQPGLLCPECLPMRSAPGRLMIPLTALTSLSRPHHIAGHAFRCETLLSRHG